MFNKFKEMSAKDQIYVLIIVFAAVWVYAAVCILPFFVGDNSLPKKKARLSELKSSFVYIEKKAALIPEDVDTKKSKAVSLLSYIEDSAKELDLSKKVVYIKPISSKNGQSAEVRLDNAQGSDIVNFLSKMCEEGVLASKLNFSDNDIDGLWSTKIQLELRSK